MQATLPTVTIQLPQTTFEGLERIAVRQQSSVSEAVFVLVSEKENLPALSDEIESELASYWHLSNETLMLLTHPPLTDVEAAEMTQLTNKSSLSEEEASRSAELLTRYERGLLRRSAALAILKQRGIDTAPFLTNNLAV